MDHERLGGPSVSRQKQQGLAGTIVGRIDKIPLSGLDYILVSTKLATMNLGELQKKAGTAEAMLKAVANRNRLVILCELLKGERW